MDTQIQSEQKQEDKYIPYFRIKPDAKRSNYATIRYVGSANDQEKIIDEQMNITEESKILSIELDSVYDITGRIYKSNIIGSHIVYSHRYPVVYLDVAYDRTIVSGSLFQIFYSIEIDHSEKRNVKELKKYVGLNFSGKWVRHFDGDTELKENYEAMLRDEGIYLYNKQYLTDESVEYNSEKCDKWVDEFVQTEKQYFESFFNDQYVVFNSIDTVRDKFIEDSKTEQFKRFIKIALKCRELQRRNNYGVQRDFAVPTVITKMSDMTNKLIEDNEIAYDDEE